jgi:CRP-like cAMP-binding protein
MNIIRLFEDTPDIIAVPVGESIFERGDPGDKMYVVLEGIVEIRLGDRVLETVDSGGIFGEMALIDPAIRSASAVAQCGCRLAIVDETLFLQMVQQTPMFALEMMRVLASRLRKADRKLAL